jgi:anaerobic selenocysteine-containing dehydrogenase
MLGASRAGGRTMDGSSRQAHSVCPHDCPSTCALDVEVLDERRIGRVRGARDNSYTLGVVCAKVGRYAERIHHPDRLLNPLRRTGPKGSGHFTEISWDEALDRSTQAFQVAEQRHGAEAVWPYFYAGTMGHLMRDGVERLTHVKKWSRYYDTICVGLSFPGYQVGTGRLTGIDPREMAKSDLIVLWGTNPVSTQVNVMTHAMRARKERGARIAAVDIYHNGTMAQADLALCLQPGTDAALAVAIMHVLFRDGYADQAYMSRYTDDPQGLAAHVRDRTPAWASAITGLSVAEIEAFATAIGQTKNTFFRLGYGFTRSRNGAAAMHAVTCIPAVTGAWSVEGGGALHSNSGLYTLDKTLIEGLDARDMSVRALDQSRVGSILTGNPTDLKGGPPVTAMLIQNTNPMEVAPDQSLVRAGFAREDLFTVVHEQFMTETARMADIVLPATMFLEHDDLYTSSGHTHLQLATGLVPPPGQCRSNHDVISGLAQRLGAEHRGFAMTPREILDETLQASGYGSFAALEKTRWIDCALPFRDAHFLDGFGWPDGKFRFKADWAAVGKADGYAGLTAAMPTFPDQWNVIEAADDRYPFRLATAPSRSYLNSSFNETVSSRAKEGAPHALIHPDDLAELGIADGGAIRMGSQRGTIGLTARAFDGLQRGVVIVESIAPNQFFADGLGINTLTGADPVAPFGGAAFHDNKVWIKPA